MAKKNTENDQKEEGTALATQEPAALVSPFDFGNIEGVQERPESLERESAGIDPSELRLPRLAIAQGLSPQVTPGNPLYIEGLPLFHMFNDLTGEIYGRGPIRFIPVRRQIVRIEFRPRSEGGGVVDMNVPANDPRLIGHTEDGIFVPPVATAFTEYVIMMFRPGKMPEPIVMSVKKTNKWNRMAIDRLDAYVNARNAKMYTGFYTIDTLNPATNEKGTFGVPNFKNAGFIPKDTAAGAALLQFMENFHDQISGKKLVVNREPGDDDFNPSEMEKTGDTDGM